MAGFNTVGGKNYTLSSSISSTATSITLSSFTLPITDQAITMATASTDIMYGTLQPGSTNSELISFTGVTQNASGTATLTGVTRGLDREYPYTESSDFKLPHPGQSIFILSDAPQVFYSYPAKASDETITGSWSFPTPTLDANPATKEYADDLAIAGAPNATTTVKGIVELATQAEVDARTATGTTGASLVATPALNRNVLTHDYAASSAGTDAYAITLTPAVTAYTTGDIYYFKADVANTGACTLNVNALGVKNIKIGGADPITGTIAANSIVEVQYDGTSMNILAVSDWITQTATAGKIVQRNSTGDITVPTTPSASTDAASKSYVDINQYAVYAGSGDVSQSIDALKANSYIKLTQTFQVNGHVNGTSVLTATFGGSTVGTFTYVITNIATLAGTMTGTFIAFIKNNGVTNSQTAGLLSAAGTTGTTGGNGYTTGTSSQTSGGALTVDTSTSKTLATSNSNTGVITLGSYLIEVFNQS